MQPQIRSGNTWSLYYPIVVWISPLVGGNDCLWQCSIAGGAVFRCMAWVEDPIHNRDNPHVHHLWLGPGQSLIVCTVLPCKHVHGPYTPFHHKKLSGSQPSWISGWAAVGVAVGSPLMRPFAGSKPPSTLPLPNVLFKINFQGFIFRDSRLKNCI